jgi:hypothetical protein
MASLKEKHRKTGKLTAGVTRSEKSTLKNAIENINSVNMLLAYIFLTVVALLSHIGYGAKVRVRYI